MIKIYKGKSVPVHPMKAHRGEENYSSMHHLKWALDGSGQLQTPAALLPGKEAGTYWIEGWVGSEKKNLLPLPRFEPRTIYIIRYLLLTYLLAYLLACLLTYSVTYLLTHSLTQLLTYLLT